MARRRDIERAVKKYRAAAIEMFSLSEEQAAQTIYAPYDDRGEWAPDSLAVICLETGHVMSYWDEDFWEKCNEMSRLAGMGYVECINAAICAVYP